jgi:hypothetical protein
MLVNLLIVAAGIVVIVMSFLAEPGWKRTAGWLAAVALFAIAIRGLS